jgi:hypothetical protein
MLRRLPECRAAGGGRGARREDPGKRGAEEQRHAPVCQCTEPAISG